MAPQTTYSTSTLANHIGRDFGLSAPILLDQTRIGSRAHPPLCAAPGTYVGNGN
jgi:hypothetical protein